MKRNHGYLFILYPFIASILLFVTPACTGDQNLPPEPGLEQFYPALVTAVIDGDTIQIHFTGAIPAGCRNDERVRLIGVNTPELSPLPEYYAEEARNYTNTALYRKTVELELDTRVTGLRDRYNRLLAFVWLDMELFNETLIREGYGYYYDYFDFKAEYMEWFALYEQEAKALKKGVWAE